MGPFEEWSRGSAFAETSCLSATSLSCVFHAAFAAPSIPSSAAVVASDGMTDTPNSIEKERGVQMARLSLRASPCAALRDRAVVLRIEPPAVSRPLRASIP